MGIEGTELMLVIKSIAVFFGALLIISGLLLCIFPEVIKKLNEFSKKLLFTDERVLKHNVSTGVIFILIGLVILISNFIWK